MNNTLALQLHNPWWTREELILEDSKIIEFSKQKYQWIPEFYHHFPKNKDVILTLRGPRQVGKTTLVKLLIKKILLKNKHQRELIFYYPCDNIENFKELYELLFNFIQDTRAKEPRQRLYLFLDEISFVKEWQRAIKSLADLDFFKNATLLITGSNSLDILFSGERLPGRRGQIFSPDIELLPLSFRELVLLVKPDIEELNAAHKDRLLKKLLFDYLVCGGFPASINEYFTKTLISPARYEVYLQWIQGDLHKTNKSEDLGLRLISRLVDSISSTVSWYNLAKRTGIVSHSTVEEYVDILEKIFVLNKIFYCSLNGQPDYKKNKKIYFIDPFIFNTLKTKIDGFLGDAYVYSLNYLKNSELLPKIMENLVHNYLNRSFDQVFYFSGKNKEIDFITKHKSRRRYFEVKYQNKVRVAEFREAQKMIGANNLTVITKQDYESCGYIKLIPIHQFLFSSL
ncbi:MAG: ATP-binding protein [Patescibacteria group bacterium]